MEVGRTREMLRYISSRDQRLMKRLNGWLPPRWIRVWMIYATRLGDGWLWYAMGLILAFFGGPSRFAALSAAALSGALAVILFQSLKGKAKRRRPCATEPHAWATLLPPDQFSFPSGHSMTAFAVAVPLSLYYPSLLVGLMFCAVSIALSRILLGMHFLSDVLAGSVLGGALGYAVYWFLQ
jgi:undecaprenyl-diphosphatase